jgi:hypothetical protein
MQAVYRYQQVQYPGTDGLRGRRRLRSLLHLRKGVRITPLIAGVRGLPFPSIGSIVALACALLIAYVLVAERHWLWRMPTAEDGQPADHGYREPALREKVVEVPESLRPRSRAGRYADSSPRWLHL